ncbi:hypothetical protein [Psychrobacter pygoscelis]|uniref:hypothetical protein n=1 Tax=Psychrobacter pygoscelis TaxID=2488563 RepID=UPI001F6236B4|nr:hypothetical protein [Psychrobacter pygoscelis]
MSRPSIIAQQNSAAGNKKMNGDDGSAETNNASTDTLTDSTLMTLNTTDPELSKSELLAAFTVSALPVQKLNDSTHNQTTTEQRLALYQRQLVRTRQLYSASVQSRPTYLVQRLKSQFDEYQHFLMSISLDKRGVVDTEMLQRLWQQLHIVDDIIEDIIRHMPAQQPAGWQITTQGRNYLRLPTVGRLRQDEPVADQGSLVSYVLAHFGVMSYTYDRSYYIGHVLGYLFCCYFCAHLSITYGVTPLAPNVVQDFDYASLETPKMVRLLQALDGYCKKRIYQLAVICARLSYYATDRRIEKMLIAEVNDFDKKLQQSHLDTLLSQGMMPEARESGHPSI